MPIKSERRYFFKAVHKLQRAEEYSAVFRSKRSYSSSYFCLYYLPTKHTSARLGVIVGKRLSKQAVQRHLIKRLVREHFRLQRHKLINCDIIIRLKSSVNDISRKQLTIDLAQLFARLFQK